ncbi:MULTISPECIES: helix-turn-helix transcriptional regulator [unclassified Streptomyces]|uniref:helix-turn-helix domain-containing protein n=1 Tax=unclassified Streptomyces TaxID=2593676 RepID=UPI0027DF2EDD|nr:MULTISPECIES: helix-turn-helix transcriptional regulator [unclassified Streptomyces]
MFRRAETYLDLRLALQSLRAYRSLSLRQLAHLMPYSHSSVAAVLSGARPVSPYFLRNYLEACGVTSPTELISWFDLFSVASPEHQNDAARTRLMTMAMNGRHSASSRTWRSGALPVGAEIVRLRKFSLQARSKHLREWLSVSLSDREKRAMFRRLEKRYGMNAVDLSLFARGEWELPLVEVNRMVGEAKRLGYTDIDPLVESVFRNQA